MLQWDSGHAVILRLHDAALAAGVSGAFLYQVDLALREGHDRSGI